MEEIVVFRYDEVIQAPIDIVFQYVDDDEKIKRWNEFLVENLYEGNAEDRYKPGTRFKTVQKYDNKRITVNCELVEYDPPRKVVIHSRSKEGLSITRYSLSREDDGTRLVVEAAIVPSNFFYKMATKLFGWASKATFVKQYRNLKTYIETHVHD